MNDFVCRYNQKKAEKTDEDIAAFKAEVKAELAALKNEVNIKLDSIKADTTKIKV